jgi:hypothetical protein
MTKTRAWQRVGEKIAQRRQVYADTLAQWKRNRAPIEHWAHATWRLAAGSLCSTRLRGALFMLDVESLEHFLALPPLLLEQRRGVGSKTYAEFKRLRGQLRSMYELSIRCTCRACWEAKQAPVPTTSGAHMEGGVS